MRRRRSTQLHGEFCECHGGGIVVGGGRRLWRGLQAGFLPEVAAHHDPDFYDPLRNQLDIPTNNGDILRYDVATQQFVAGIHFSSDRQDPLAALDGRYLYVTDQNAAIIHKVDLTTGADTPLAVPQQGQGYALKILSSGVAIFEAGGTYYSLNPSADAITPVNTGPLANKPGWSAFFLSQDRGTLLIDDLGDSGDPLYLYDANQNAITGTASDSFGWWRSDTAAVSRDGLLVATARGYQQRIRNRLESSNAGGETRAAASVERVARFQQHVQHDVPAEERDIAVDGV